MRGAETKGSPGRQQLGDGIHLRCRMGTSPIISVGAGPHKTCHKNVLSFSFYNMLEDHLTEGQGEQGLGVAPQRCLPKGE